jgi:hypothetical protein
MRDSAITLSFTAKKSSACRSDSDSGSDSVKKRRKLIEQRKSDSDGGSDCVKRGMKVDDLLVIQLKI